MEKLDPEKYGRFNDFPPNWKKATEDEFWNRFMGYSPIAYEYRQMTTFPGGKKSSKLIAGKLYLFSDGVGLAFVSNVKGCRHISPLLYKFAICEHKNKVEVPEKSRMCHHVSKCVDCNREFHVDSSDYY